MWLSVSPSRAINSAAIRLGVIAFVAAAISLGLLTSSCDLGLGGTEYHEITVEVEREVTVEVARRVEVEVTRETVVEVTRVKIVELPHGVSSPTATFTPTATLTPTITPTPTPTQPPTPTPIPIEEIDFTGTSFRTNEPSQVQVVFSLRDQNGHAIVRPAEEIQRDTRVFEDGDNTSGFEEIDYSETSFFVHTAENFDLEVVFVLDFTNSMAQTRLPGGRSGIEAMIEAFESALHVLPSAHRIGVVEFHDRNADPSVLSELTTDRGAIRQRVLAFYGSGFDPGASRVWDAVTEGVGLFSDSTEKPRTVRALVFLSDGRDTSSLSQRGDARNQALERGVQLYAMGVGEVYQRSSLAELGSASGGGYYSARDPAFVQEQLQIIVNDLRGQYQLSYITLRRAGFYHTAIEIELDGVVGGFATDGYDAGSFYGLDNQGIVGLDPPSIDRESGTATVYMRSLHMPRNIDRIRFRLGSEVPYSLALVPREEGGMLEGWRIEGPDESGFLDLVGDAPLEFGNFGLLLRLTFSGVTQDGIVLAPEFDNSIYPGEKRLHFDALTEFRLTGSASSGDTGSGRIAFGCKYGDNWDICMINADGSGFARLTDHSGSDFVSDWSPDGRRIAFTSDRSGQFEIYVMNADRSELVQITGLPGGAADARWSPDGTRIAFISPSPGDDSKLYIMNADGSALRLLSDHPGDVSSHSWSPDGDRIVYECRSGENVDICQINADGSGFRRLVDNDARNFGAVWRPDGGSVAFYSNLDGDREIYFLDANEFKRLTDNSDDDIHPKWSPDGQQIAFSSGRGGDHDIYVMNADGSGKTMIAGTPASDLRPRWSPDGSQLAFYSRVDDSFRLFVVDADGSNLTELRIEADAAIFPRWSPR